MNNGERLARDIEDIVRWLKVIAVLLAGVIVSNVLAVFPL